MAAFVRALPAVFMAMFIVVFVATIGGISAAIRRIPVNSRLAPNNSRLSQKNSRLIGCQKFAQVIDIIIVLWIISASRRKNSRFFPGYTGICLQCRRGGTDAAQTVRAGLRPMPA
jgi:hypothetical protein